MNDSVESEAQDREHVVRIDRAVDERVAGAHTLHLLHVDVHGAGNAVLVASALAGLDDDAAQVRPAMPRRAGGG